MVTGTKKRGRARPFDFTLAGLCWDLGLSHESTAFVMRRSVEEVRYQWSVLTGEPVGDDPEPVELARRILEVEDGWTAEIREQASRAIPFRVSSAVVRANPKSRAGARRREKERVGNGS